LSHSRKHFHCDLVSPGSTSPSSSGDSSLAARHGNESIELVKTDQFNHAFHFTFSQRPVVWHRWGVHTYIIASERKVYIPEPDDKAISIKRQEQSTTLFVPAIAFWDTW
jgi:hypothetical protein